MIEVRDCRQAQWQPIDQAVDLWNVIGLGRSILPRPPLDLSRDIIARSAEIAEPHGNVVDSVERSQGVDHRFIVRAPNLFWQGRQRSVEVTAPLDHFHQVKDGADYSRVLAQGDRAGYRETCGIERRQQPVFAVDRMGRGQQRAERLATQDVAPGPRLKPVGRIGLAAREFLEAVDPSEARHCTAQPLTKG